MPAPDPTPLPGRRAVGVVIPLLLLLVALPTACDLYIDQRWYAALGHGGVFTATLWAKSVCAGIAAVAMGLALFGNLRLAVRLSRDDAPLYLHDELGIARVNLSEVGTRLAAPASLLLAVLAGVMQERQWPTWLGFMYSTPFGVKDPIFGRDVAFHVLERPFYDAWSSFALFLVAACTVGTAAMYAVRGAIAVAELQTRVSAAARTHLCALLATVFVVLACRDWLGTFEVLTSHVGPMTGASYADVHARLPALHVQIAIAGVCAVLMLAAANRTGFALPIAAVILYAGAQFGAQAYPDFVHRFSVKPNELEREAPFLAHNITATRTAFGLERVTERALNASASLTAADVEHNRDTIDNVRLWDHRPLLATFSQLQEIATYYDFASIDNDRYVIGGKLRQTMLSARELNSDSLPNRTWINEHFVYTHGYGITLGPVNEATAEGLPVLFVQDIPPKSTQPELHVAQPAIYFGERSSDHVFVRTRAREFHHPSSAGDVTTEYTGKDGIRFDSALMRLALSVKLGTLNLLLSDDIDSDSRVLLHRNVLERLQRVAPYLLLDQDPYLVVRSNGRLAWICDGYTVTDRYPYAQTHPELHINYMRNSVKAVIDAYDGTVTLYVADERDPLLAVWRHAFPDSFTPLSAMPADLRAHLRAPLLGFEAQTEMFTTYHMQDAELLYKREDQWEIPGITVGDERTPIEPYYTVMRLPGEAKPEFILMLPFTPKRKDNLSAWMVARCDGERLGQLMVYRFPRERLVFGPQQIINRINQDPEISRQISLWDQRGSEAVFGTLLVIPIEESLLYVRPLYLRSEGGKIPELKRVIVVHEKRIAMKASLREAVDALFELPVAADAGAAAAAGAAVPSAGAEPGPGPVVIEAPTTAALPADAPLQAQALEHFERALSAQRRGDWAGYGAELEHVETLLRSMQPGSRQPAPDATREKRRPAAPAPTLTPR
jgi:uncharacterized membrane protein (UPF0182 family)